jgi:signal transduction histidine kinase
VSPPPPPGGDLFSQPAGAKLLELVCRAASHLDAEQDPERVVPRLYASAEEALGVAGLLVLSLQPDGLTVRRCRAAGAVPELRCWSSTTLLSGCRLSPPMTSSEGPGTSHRLILRFSAPGLGEELVVAWLPPGSTWCPWQTQVMTVLAAHATTGLRSAELHAAAASAAHVRGEFQAVISHELRTPLKAIAGFTELLAQGALGPLTPGQHEAFLQVLASARAMRHLLDHALGVGSAAEGSDAGQVLS